MTNNPPSPSSEVAELVERLKATAMAHHGAGLSFMCPLLDQAADHLARLAAEREESDRAWVEEQNSLGRQIDDLTARAAKAEARVRETEGEIEALFETDTRAIVMVKQEERLMAAEASLKASEARREELEKALHSIAKPTYGIGFNGLRKIARAALTKDTTT